MQLQSWIELTKTVDPVHFFSCPCECRYCLCIISTDWDQCRRLASTRRPRPTASPAGRQVYQVVSPPVRQLDWVMKLVKGDRGCGSGCRTSAAHCVWNRLTVTVLTQRDEDQVTVSIDFRVRTNRMRQAIAHADQIIKRLAPQLTCAASLTIKSVNYATWQPIICGSYNYMTNWQ